MRTSRGPIVFVTLLAVALGPSSSLGVGAQDDFDDFAPVAPSPSPAPALPPPLPPPPSAPTPAPRPAPPALPAPIAPPTPPTPSPSPSGFDDDFGAAPTPPAPAPSPSGFDDDLEPPAATEAATTTEAAPEAEAEVEAAAEAEVEAEAAPATATDDRAAIASRRGMRRANSVYGSVGGIHVLDAGSGPVGTFRLSLMSDFMFIGDFLERGDYAKRIEGVLAFSWTMHRNFEVFASYQSTATWNTLGDPELIQSLGDVQLGLKAFHAIKPWLVLGGDFALRFANPVGNVGVAFRGTSFGFRGNVSFDLRELPSRSIPFVARFNAQYWFDNSRNLVRDVENARYDGLEMPRPRTQEQRNLITDIERFALDINRTDFVNLRFGFEAPIEVGRRVQIDPLLEWIWGIPVNRTGFVCPYLADDDDGCLDHTGPKGFPMSLTIGARVHPVVRGLSLTAAVDVGLTGTRTIAREVATTMPYAIVLGASYAYDPGLRADRTERVSERVVELPPVYPIRGHVRGTVFEAGTESTIAGAIVRFEGRDANAIVTDDGGAFRSYSFEPGDVAMHVEHPDYEVGNCVATIPSELPTPAAAPEASDESASGSPDASAEAAPSPDATAEAAPSTDATAEATPAADASSDAPSETSPDASSTATPGPHTPEEAEIEVAVRCELVARPRNGAISLRVVPDQGALSAPVTITLSGADNRALTTAADGTVRVDSLPAGHYVAHVQQEGFFTREQEFDVMPRGDGSVEIALITRPRRPLVRIAGRRIQISRQVNFVTDSDEILPTSDPLLYEVLDALQSHPEITQVEIEGHTDDRGGAEHNQTLSQRRAEAVRTWLITHGIAESRLSARGYGQTRPLVPNITPSNRARNRRVQFTIRESAAAD